MGVGWRACTCRRPGMRPWAKGSHQLWRVPGNTQRRTVGRCSVWRPGRAEPAGRSSKSFGKVTRGRRKVLCRKGSIMVEPGATSTSAEHDRIVAGGEGSAEVAREALAADPAKEEILAIRARMLRLLSQPCKAADDDDANQHAIRDDATQHPIYDDAASSSTSGVVQQLVVRPSMGDQGRRRKQDAMSTVQTFDHPLALVWQFAVDVKPLQAVRHAFESLRQDPHCSRTLTFAPKKLRFHAERPSWKSDIRWISSRDEATFAWFAQLFEKLGIRSALHCLGELTLFSGFIVARQVTRKSYFHTDFDDSGGKAFTLSMSRA